MSKSPRLKMILRLLTIGLLSAFANANSQMCAANVAASTTYYIPSVRDFCKTSTPCPKFRRQVRLQGSGLLPGNKLLTYNGKIRSMGSCDTAFGASGKCLTPYISVAADPRYYRMGDIIEMPSLKGKEITLPNGRTMVHPGYLIVQDTGGAIKGVNRFDFFTGTMNMSDRRNAFGMRGRPSLCMTDKTDCDERKMFFVIRRGSSGYESSLAAIDNSLRGTGTTRNVASTIGKRGTY